MKDKLMEAPKMLLDDYVIFNSKLIDETNRRIILYKPYMYVVSTYNPKPCIYGNAALNFRIAITNAYGLYKDCGNYMRNFWNSFTSQEKATDYGEFLKFVEAARTIFCHNQDGSGKTIEQKEIFVQRVKEILSDAIDKNEGCLNVLIEDYKHINSINFDKILLLNLSDTAMELLTEKITIWCERITGDICVFFDTLPTQPEQFRQRVLDKWCSDVARWYSRSSNIQYIVAKDYHNLYRRACNLGSFNSWFCRKKKDLSDMGKIVNVIQTMRTPSSPLETMYSVLEQD